MQDSRNLAREKRNGWWIMLEKLCGRTAHRQLELTFQCNSIVRNKGLKIGAVLTINVEDPTVSRQYPSLGCRKQKALTLLRRKRRAAMDSHVEEANLRAHTSSSNNRKTGSNALPCKCSSSDSDKSWIFTSRVRGSLTTELSDRRPAPCGIGCNRINNFKSVICNQAQRGGAAVASSDWVGDNIGITHLCYDRDVTTEHQC
ncbi:MAG: hypothetical protein N2379_11035 [Verrucomicrobiae bacterium]|nr:hypothetical protein [Verrucomicrobiae bacterium]